MDKALRIGTRDSPLAVWQALQVQEGLRSHGMDAELVRVKSEGDLDLVTPLYAMGVQGVFTRALDAALLNGRIDLAVHSMKDVPTTLADGICQAAVLPRGPAGDLLVYKRDAAFTRDPAGRATVATGSARRRAQWLHRYPNHLVTDLRGNVNTRLRKLQEQPWDGAIFATAGLERIGLRPAHSLALEWMLPAPAQGVIMLSCRDDDRAVLDACSLLDHPPTARCAAIERAFLQTLLGGCSTPISAHARLEGEWLVFDGQVLSPDGKRKAEVSERVPAAKAGDTGQKAAERLLRGEGGDIVRALRARDPEKERHA